MPSEGTPHGMPIVFEREDDAWVQARGDGT